MNNDIENVLDDLRWSQKPIPVDLRDGDRMMHIAVPSNAFWLAWRNSKHSFTTLGVFPTKQSDQWVVCRPPGFAQPQRAMIPSPKKASAGFNANRPKGKKYYHFQEAGIEWALKRDSAYIADDPGIGKTIQAIGIINCDTTIKRVLIVTKASLKENWLRELSAWLSRPFTFGMVEGKKWPDRQIVVINYDLLHAHYGAIRRDKWDMIVLDEVQSIKSRKSRRTKHIIGFAPSQKKQAQGEPVITPLQGRRKVCLSGTPIENRPEELWTALNFLDAEKWPSWWDYVNRYCDVQRTSFGLLTNGASNINELRSRISALMIRRLKKDVLSDLPPKTRVVIEMIGDFNGVARAERDLLGNFDDVQADDELSFVRAVMNIKRSKELVGLEQLSRVRHKTAVAKVPALIESIKEDMEECKKCLVFFHHRDVGESLSRAFPNSVLIMGDTQNRQKLCDKFQNDPKCRQFFGSIRACGEGLNLTAADLVVFAECDWAPSKVTQAEDRAVRIGQRCNVLVKHYVVPGTIDAHMIRRVVEKQQVIDQIIC